MTSHFLNDRKLVHLQTVINPEAMASRFIEHFQIHQSRSDFEIEKCAIEKIYYRPGKSCGVLYRLIFHNDNGKQSDHWFFGRMYPPGRGYSHYEVASSQTNDAPASNHSGENLPGFIKEPVHFLPELDMVLWTFPFDPKMPGLQQSADPAFVKQQIDHHLPAFGLTTGWQAERIDCRRIKYMPGKRCVLRYQVRMAGPSGESRDVIFYSKTYHDGKSQYHFNILQTAYAQLRTQAAIVGIPRPLLHFESANTFWQEEWQGKPLLEVLEEYDGQQLFEKIATLLAALHRSQLDLLCRAPDPDDILKTATEDGLEFIHVLPEYRQRLETLLEHLAAAKARFEQHDFPAVPIHGAIRLEQMLVRGEELALVDFDALALGDPLADVAEFIASLHYLELSCGLSRDFLTKAADWFYDSYAQQVPWPCDRRRVAWYVLAFGISKIFLSLKNLNVRALQQLDSAGQEIINHWLALLD
ncbi:MAG: aminoglycoside phosphotransferase family protein [candidate division KSB1 bacterium]|nr:aminoglycoside phosphotransferase family protein [candidate division KSB1 bacterium]MDZ7302414.1 aminoglycoside phosphotransferase family protein [candidate division KSB1 bacterium]MDZ7311616.1 aminoglycoside phosphotransferase family protein [candidate division KSB1 bacterium]